ncbi:hypothetical protein BJF85_07435 [Saccharomonospora sp. CUA-673]|nr:hypothetical protein BJF85_07435 [Saccharomonospora sp. CUA-673]
MPGPSSPTVSVVSVATRSRSSACAWRIVDISTADNACGSAPRPRSVIVSSVGTPFASTVTRTAPSDDVRVTDVASSRLCSSP